MRLEGEAKAAGGRVEVLLGNHEVMNMLRELSRRLTRGVRQLRGRRVRGPAGEGVRRAAGSAKRSGAAGTRRSRSVDGRAPARLCGYVEAMGPRGRYGKWLRDHKAAVRIGTTAFMHAGIDPESSAVPSTT